MRLSRSPLLAASFFTSNSPFHFLSPLSLSLFQVELSAADVSIIFNKYDLDGDGYIEYVEFMKLVDFKPRVNTRENDRDRDRDRDRDDMLRSQLQEKIDDLVSRIRRRLEDTLGSSANSGSRLKQVFEEIDDNDSGSLSKRELGKALEQLRVDVTSREIDLLFDRFDEDNSGELDYKEFLRLLDFRPASGGRQAVEY